VDVGTRTVKLAQLERAADRLRLVDAAVVPRTTSAAGCREEVRAALSLATRLAGRTAACTMSMHWCQAKPLRIPAGAAAQQRSVVAGELDCLGCLEEHEYDFWKTGVEAKASEPQVQSVIALAVPQSRAVEVAGDVLRSGLDCRLLDGMPLALARAAHVSCASDDCQPAAALDWGFAEATFCTLSGPTPTFVRRLRGCGFGSILQPLGSQLGLQLDEVESLLLQGYSAAGEGQGVGREVHETIAELAAPPLRAMVDELQRTLAFLGNQLPEVLPEKIWLFGAGAVWNHAAEFLASRIDRPVENWRLSTAGIEKTAELPFPEEVLAPAVSLSALAWSSL